MHDSVNAGRGTHDLRPSVAAASWLIRSPPTSQRPHHRQSECSASGSAQLICNARIARRAELVTPILLHSSSCFCCCPSSSSCSSRASASAGASASASASGHGLDWGRGHWPFPTISRNNGVGSFRISSGTIKLTICGRELSGKEQSAPTTAPPPYGGGKSQSWGRGSEVGTC